MAEPDPMEGVVENSLARCERKAECGLEKKITKRPKIKPTVLSPARKSGGFIQSIQLPGHMAAVPTVSVNITTALVLLANICVEHQAC